MIQSAHQATGTLAALVLLVACNGQHRDPSESTKPETHAEPMDTNPSFDPWLGQWTGPEGTLLFLAEKNGGYAVRIVSLDGPASYEGKAAGDHIEFQRNGGTESIRATDGKATGMKWLAEKSDCLTIRQGEGFCRG